MTVTQTQTSKCYTSAMRMLVRREHSRLELEQKLQLKAFDELDIVNTVDLLVEQDYQSNERFAQEFIQMRFNQGKGPIKIAGELRQRGIEHFDLSVFDWFALARSIRENKYGVEALLDYNEQAKQKRFLQSRGFNFEQINQSFINE
ncbi:MAG TPA: regulatory protein RecX [Piscirickettsiaceae bacterium]|nr:regulatory protein RecX [Piscirickettsiaceae bacterium]